MTLKTSKINFLLIIFFALVLFLVFPLLFLPLGRDQELYAYYGMAWSKGVWPYLGYYDWNMMGLALLDLIIFRFFGNSVLAIRMIELMMLCLSIFLLYNLFRKMDIKLWFFLILYFVYSYISLGYYHMGERDCFILFWLVFILYFFVNITPNNILSASFFIGTLFSTLIFFKLGYLMVFLFFLPLFYFFSPKDKLRHIKFIFLGFIIFPTLFFLSYLLKGETVAIYKVYYNLFVLAYLLYPAYGATLYSLSSIVEHFSYVFILNLATTTFLLIILLSKNPSNKIIIAFESLKKGKWNFLKNSMLARVLFFSAIVQIAYALVIFFQGTFQEYHLPPLKFFTAINTILLGSLVLENSISQTAKRYAYFLSYIVFVFILVFSRGFPDQVKNIKNNYKIALLRILKNEIYSPDSPNFWPKAHQDLAKSIQRLTQRDDFIQLWALDVGPYFLAERLSPTKFPFTIYLNMNNFPISKQFYQEFMLELETNPPKLFIVENYDRILGYPDLIDDDIENYKELLSLLKTRYVFEEKNNLYDIYLRIEE